MGLPNFVNSIPICLLIVLCCIPYSMFIDKNQVDLVSDKDMVGY